MASGAIVKGDDDVRPSPVKVVTGSQRGEARGPDDAGAGGTEGSVGGDATGAGWPPPQPNTASTSASRMLLAVVPDVTVGTYGSGVSVR